MAWLVVVSLGSTVVIGGLLIGTLGPGLDQMVANAPTDRPVEDLEAKLQEPPPTSVPAAPVTPLPAAPAPAPRAARPASPPEAFESEWEAPREEARARRARRTVEPPTRALRRQIRELEHLRDALEREYRQIERYSRQERRWDPDGHHIRRMRLAQLDVELARVDRDIRRLERGRPTLD